MMSSIQTTEQLGDVMRAARKHLGLTQPQLALAAGVGVRFIVDLEAGKATLRLENVLDRGHAGLEICSVSLNTCSTGLPLVIH